MKLSVSRKVTGTATAMIILVLVFGGIIYLRTDSNAWEIDNRNLRELSRIGQSIEGRVNNLQKVLKSLGGEKPDNLGSKAELIPYLNANIDQEYINHSLRTGNSAFDIDMAGKVLQLWYNGLNDTVQSYIHAVYDFEAIRPALSSDYLETVFLADPSGSVFMWETDRAGVRIHELAALDSVNYRSGNDPGGIGVSDIIQIPVAGQEYRLYLLPIRINLNEMSFNGDVSESEYTKWILGGMIPISDYRQQSFSLDPYTALILGFLVITGFLAVPFIRVFTMGPRERLKIGHLLYLVIVLILGTGLIGFYMADLSHFFTLKSEVRDQLRGTADAIVQNLDMEIMDAMNQLESFNDSLSILSMEAGEPTDSLIDITGSEFSQFQMMDSIRTPNVSYPYFHMVFWADSAGMQIAKWTPRSQNTPRVEVADREYFRAIINEEGWKRKFNSEISVNSCENDNSYVTDAEPYYIESIRSWTTGENLAAISVPWQYRDGNDEIKDGITAITTELASLTHPVLPAGIGLAIVDASARTLFHTRPERILEENFTEETDQGERLRSILAARACGDLELTYGGRRKMVVVRPLAERPLFLIVYKDRSLIDTVRFEAWFEGSALFGIWTVIILILIFMLDQITTTRLGWLWPDLDKSGKYLALLIISLPFIFVQMHTAFIDVHSHLHPATLLIPIQFLGLGLVILSWDRWPNPRDGESILGWILFIIATLILLKSAIGYDPFPWLEIFAALLSMILVINWIQISKARDFMNSWARDVSPRLIYTASMVFGLLIIGILPGYLTYKFTFHDHSEHLVKYHQLELVDALKTRENRINRFKNEQQNPVLQNIIADQVYDRAYDNLLFRSTKKETTLAPTTTDNNTDIHNTIHSLLGDKIPYLTQASIKMRQLSADQADRRWIYSEHRDTLQIQINDEYTIVSVMPSVANWLNSWRILLFIGLIGGIFLIIYWVSRRIFFIHMEHSEPMTMKNAIPDPGEKWQSMILVGTRSISREPLKNRSEDVQMIDMISRETAFGDILELTLELISENAKVVCLDNFDHRLEEQKWNRYMLEFLEKSLFTEFSKPFVLITSRDLNEALITAESNGELPEDYKRRWDRILGRFTKIILSDNVSEKPFEMLLQFRIIQKLTGDLNKHTISLCKSLDRNKSQENTKEINQQIAYLSVKMEWLKDELNRLFAIVRDIKMNSEEIQFNTGSEYSGSKIQEEIENLKHQLTRNFEKMEILAGQLKRKTDTDIELSNKIDEIVRKAGNKINLLRDITGVMNRDGDYSEQSGQEFSVISRFKHQVQFFYKMICMWIVPSARMKAERGVNREKRNVRSVCLTLLNECGRHQRLHEAGRQILTRSDWFDLKESEVVDLILDGAETYYSARWAILTNGERLVAAQLARGAVLNPKLHRSITRLFARGLIKKNPELQLDNRSFAKFVNETVSSDLLNKWERGGIPSTWELIRGPLFIALIIVALFLFWAQREFLGSTIAFLSTVGVGLGVILNLLSKLERGAGTAEVKDNK
jgi:hypothetical protein